MKKVVKFGGSSLASAEQFKKVGEIIKADDSRRYVVPSAPGKRSSDDTKVTDMLLHVYETAAEGKDISEEIKAIKARYDEIIKGLGLKGFSLDKEFEEITEKLKTEPEKDYAAARGEYLNGKIMAKYLDAEFIDAAEVIFFNEEGNLNDYKTDKTLGARLAACDKAVIPGFYGLGKNGKIKTFSRGGSDVTGSIVAKASKADVYENWTDVSGFLVADPRIIENPKGIRYITYRELRELSYMGASVLHEDAIFPVRKCGIPINIRNTNAPEDEGRTEKATPGKIKKAREEGRVARSGELTAVVAVLAAVVFMIFWGRHMAAELKWLLGQCVELAAGPEGSYAKLAAAALGSFCKAVLPLLLVVFAASLAAELAQVGFQFSWKPLRPRWDRLRRQHSSRRTGFQLGHALLKTVVAAMV